MEGQIRQKDVNVNQEHKKTGAGGTSIMYNSELVVIRFCVEARCHSSQAKGDTLPALALAAIPPTRLSGTVSEGVPAFLCWLVIGRT
jgi:hypothetical protein